MIATQAHVDSLAEAMPGFELTGEMKVTVDENIFWELPHE